MSEMKLLETAMRFYCGLAESQLHAGPSTVWSFDTAIAALQLAPGREALIAEMKALSPTQRTKVLRYAGSFAPLPPVGEVYVFSAPEKAAAFITEAGSRRISAEALTPVMASALGSDQGAVEALAENFGGHLYSGPSLDTAFESVDLRLPNDMLADGLPVYVIEKCLTSACSRKLSEGLLGITTDGPERKYKGRLEQFARPRKFVAGVDAKLVEGLKLGGYLNTKTLRAIGEADAEVKPVPPAQASPQGASPDRGGIAKDQVQGGAVAQSKDGEKDSPDKPTEHVPTQEEGGTGDVTLPDGTVLSADVLRQALSKLLANLSTQLSQNTVGGKPADKPADPEKPEDGEEKDGEEKDKAAEAPAPPAAPAPKTAAAAPAAPAAPPAPAKPAQESRRRRALGEGGAPEPASISPEPGGHDTYIVCLPAPPAGADHMQMTVDHIIGEIIAAGGKILGMSDAMKGRVKFRVDKKGAHIAVAAIPHAGIPHVAVKGLSETITGRTIAESVIDPNIFKAIFLVGGGASGKGFVVNKIINAEARGLHVVDSDKTYELSMKIHKLDISNDIPICIGQQMRDPLPDIVQDQIDRHIMQFHGVILDGVNDNVKKIEVQKAYLESEGYDCFCVFVDTPFEKALQRSEIRATTVDKKTGETGRRVDPERLTADNHAARAAFYDHYVGRVFGPKRSFRIDTAKDAEERDENDAKAIQHAIVQINAWLAEKPENPIAIKKIQAMHDSLKKIEKLKVAKYGIKETLDAALPWLASARTEQVLRGISAVARTGFTGQPPKVVERVLDILNKLAEHGEPSVANAAVRALRSDLYRESVGVVRGSKRVHEALARLGSGQDVKAVAKALLEGACCGGGSGEITPRRTMGGPTAEAIIDLLCSTDDPQVLAEMRRLLDESPWAASTVWKGAPGAVMSAPRKIYIPASHIGIPRAAMPQIAKEYTEDFKHWLEHQGIHVASEMVPADHLKGTQNEIDIETIKRLADAIQNKPGVKEKLDKRRILVSGDGYILDGHHRWAAQLNIDPKLPVSVYAIQLPIRELLARVKSYPHVTYGKGLGESASSARRAVAALAESVQLSEYGPPIRTVREAAGRAAGAAQLAAHDLRSTPTVKIPNYLAVFAETIADYAEQAKRLALAHHFEEGRKVSEELDVGAEDESDTAAKGFATAAEKLKALRSAAFDLTTSELIRLESLLMAVDAKKAAKLVTKMRDMSTEFMDDIKKLADMLSQADETFSSEAGKSGGDHQEQPEGEAEAAPAEAPAAAPAAAEPAAPAPAPEAAPAAAAPAPAPAPAPAKESRSALVTRAVSKIMAESRIPERIRDHEPYSAIRNAILASCSDLYLDAHQVSEVYDAVKVRAFMEDGFLVRFDEADHRLITLAARSRRDRGISELARKTEQSRETQATTEELASVVDALREMNGPAFEKLADRLTAVIGA